MSNPVEEYFFNGYSLGDLGPCGVCNYNSLTIHDFSFFELNFPESRWGACKIVDMLDKYFKSEKVNSRCKNMNCKMYPVNIMKN
jgi:ubiquitin C-terminal hydrolase